jgi:multicomponent Na+:H+ antiporter subunit A
MLWGPAALAISGLLLGLLPLGYKTSGTALAFSVIALATGAGIALAFRRPQSWVPPKPVFPLLYERGMTGLFRIAAWQTRLLQRGSLPFYVGTVSATVFLLVAAAIWRAGILQPMGMGPGVRLHEMVLAGAGVLATWVAVRSTSYPQALLALGIIGVVVSVFYALYGAPDLAMTQIAVDTLTVLLLFAALDRLPAINRRSERLHRIRHGVIAGTAGLLMALLVVLAAAKPQTTALAAYFMDASEGLAGGRNVVNVILTDFRSLDTLGEVTVLGAAGLGVWALLRLRPAGGEQ